MRGKQLPSSEKHEILRGLLEDYYYNHLSTYELAKKSGNARTTIYQRIRTF